MSNAVHPVLSVIVRKFRQEHECDVGRSLVKIQQAVTTQPGIVGLQNSLSTAEDCCELVTVFAFDSHDNLNRWKMSPIREGFVAELDQYSQNSATHEQFGNLAWLLHPKAYVRKIETVGILIFWILVLGTPLRHLTEILLPGLLAPFWEETLLVSVSVVLISYFFLPWSCKMLTRLKARIDKKGV